ncbi:hypothetical protein QBC37DRAFT_461259 [Rhypophila decipiens]|uniref:NTF2-like domain-containing protein n=1 Tax=Rhypophila decipiens TaxID=261697 RepID=A0AAN6Y8I4_9PEZI|nr:hypothetical protein QBC37DRAFT_461259 [Rhypophila decipiens]
MLFKSLLSLAALAASVSAVALKPGGPGAETSRHAGRGGVGVGQCLCQADADKLTAAYLRMIGGWNDADAKYLSDSGFKDMSDSINILAGVPLGTVIFPTKQAFIDHQHVAPDNLPLTVTFATFNCEYISLIWTAKPGPPSPDQLIVRGITILGATKSNAKFWQIKSIDMEMNSIAFLKDIGGSYTLPGQ